MMSCGRTLVALALVLTACRVPASSALDEPRGVESSAEVYRLFAAALIRDAVGASPERQRLLWITALRFNELPGTPRTERATIAINAARYFQASNVEAERLVADELLARAADEPQWAEGSERDREALWAGSRRPATRHALALFDWPVEGAAIVLDANEVCRAPCVLAVPVDGRTHEIRVAGAGDTMTFEWAPSDPDAFPPWPRTEHVGAPAAAAGGDAQVRDCLLDAKEDRCINP